VGDNLTPVDAVKFASALWNFPKNALQKDRVTRPSSRTADARFSGPMAFFTILLVNTLIGRGINVDRF